jgi:hypothetical protein
LKNILPKYHENYLHHDACAGLPDPFLLDFSVPFSALEASLARSEHPFSLHAALFGFSSSGNRPACAA